MKGESPGNPPTGAPIPDIRPHFTPHTDQPITENSVVQGILKELASKSKGLNNRGTGTIQIFCRFDKMEIDSVFVENGKSYKLNASWKKTGEYDGAPIEIQDNTENKTVVKMSSFSGNDKEQAFFLRYFENIDELKRDVLRYFLLRLWLGNIEKELKFTIRVYLEEYLKNEYTFDRTNIPVPDKRESITIYTEQAKITTDKDKREVKVDWKKVEPKYMLTIHRFKIPSNDIDENAVLLCSKDITVERFKFSAIKRKNTVFAGYRYLSSIRGDIFDQAEYVSHTGDKFNFPLKKEIESELKNSSDLFNPESEFVFRDVGVCKLNCVTAF